MVGGIVAVMTLDECWICHHKIDGGSAAIGRVGTGCAMCRLSKTFVRAGWCWRIRSVLPQSKGLRRW